MCLKFYKTELQTFLYLLVKIANCASAAHVSRNVDVFVVRSRDV